MGKGWVTGEIFGFEIPADAATLLAGGADFLTKAFRASGALAADNRVGRIAGAEEFFGGGTGKKLLLTLEYESPAPALPERLFIKFSRNFDNELWDRARFTMISEANFAVLSRSPDFPVTVPACLFADVEPQSGTGLIVTERISLRPQRRRSALPQVHGLHRSGAAGALQSHPEGPGQVGGSPSSRQIIAGV